MTVDILLTSFNVSEYLQQAIGSVLEQTYPNWRMLVMDDGSTDPAVGEILDAIDDPRVRVVTFHPTVEERRATCRYATLINWGFQQTSAPLISYLCSDDFYLPDRLERMVAAMKEGVDVVYGAQLCLDKDDVLLSERPTFGVLRDAAQRVDHNSVLHTRESFEKAGGWPEDPSGWVEADALFWTRLHKAGYSFFPVLGGPTDSKRYHPGCVGDMVPFGREPWA
jgi:glycosyltransferase involved in cell wall biosynthesis